MWAFFTWKGDCMGNILELKNLSKSYAKSEFTLDQISFSLPYGSILGFVGENGAGKTTTLHPSDSD